MKARALFAVALVALSASASACSSCKKQQEPARDTQFDPHTPDAAPIPATSATSPKLTPLEQREQHVRLAHELCENAAKVWNRLNNRSDTDPKGIDVLSTCLKRGNNAWYMCILQAPNPQAYDDCSKRLLYND